MLMKTRVAAALILAGVSSAALADAVTDKTMSIAAGWAQIKYKTAPEAQLDAMTRLKAQADAFAATSPTRAEPLIWDGIVTSTLAGLKGGLGGLSLAKESRAMLEKAEKIDGNALDGSAHTSLGALYYQVPGWPIGFGSADKAKAELMAGLKINPRGIDSNYFWADYLVSLGKYPEATAALKTAMAAAPRPGREVADAGRRGEIQTLLAKVKARS